jgi:intracellular sulfur oxidation DsrE/DsrF family protein
MKRWGMIENYGKSSYLPSTAVQPDPDLIYRLLFDCGEAGAGDGVNPGLNHIARFINLYEAAGLKPEKRVLKAIINGDAVKTALEEKEYLACFGKVNPDVELLRQLKANGVDIYVCAQSLVGRGFKLDKLNPDITLALSGLVVKATLQLRGYALIP